MKEPHKKSSLFYIKYASGFWLHGGEGGGGAASPKKFVIQKQKLTSRFKQVRFFLEALHYFL